MSGFSFSRIVRITIMFMICLIFGLAGSATSFLYAQEGGVGSVEPVADPPPLSPVLLFPEDGTTTTGKSHPSLGIPDLSWQPVPNGVKYEVQISTSSGFASTIVQQETFTTRYTPEIALGNGTFYWRVRTANEPGRNAAWGPYSEAYSFTIDWSNGSKEDVMLPSLLSPQDKAVQVAFGSSDFSWLPLPGAATYRFEISSDDSFSNVLYTATTLAPQHTPQQRLQNSVYYWRVTPIDHQGNTGLPSLVRSFTFGWDQSPQLLGPDDEAKTPFIPRFSWTAREAAKEYRLQISTQPDFGSSVLFVTTRNTDYTPHKTLSNDHDYFWRVQAVDTQGTTSPWSEVRRFRAQWNFKPQLLSPANNSTRLAYPLFAWAPVAEAERYQIQVDESNSFESPLIADETIYNNTTYTHPRWQTVLLDSAYYWRVRAIDAQGNTTPWSAVWAFQISTETTPNLVYPLPYYTPDSDLLPVHADRTIAWPLFIWDTAHPVESTAPFTVTSPNSYRLEVDDDPAFGSPNFAIETGGTAAAPTKEHPFLDLQEGGLYHWRVQAFRDGSQIGTQIAWTVRYASSASQLPDMVSSTPIYPADGFEAVGVPPVLGWTPVTGADHYRVQIARDRSFTQIDTQTDDEAEPLFVNYVPWQGGPTPSFGAYWWRVRAETAADAPLSDWSTPRRFHLSIDLVTGNQYDFVPPANLVSDASGLTYIDSSPDKGLGAYELGALHTLVDRTYQLPAPPNQNWAIAFDTGALGADPVHYALYFDTDHAENSGAPTDPRGNGAISVDPFYRPEYALYVDRTGGNTLNAWYYGWNGTAWDPPQNLTAIGGHISYTDTLQAVQILLPYTALGAADADWVGSLAFTVFSLDSNGNVYDTVPEQEGELDNPAFVSNMLMPLFPFDTPLSNPMVHFDMPLMRWRMPIFDSVDGYQVQVARDAVFTDLVETWESYESQTGSFFTLIPTGFQSKIAYEDNESYYWRVRIRHERYYSSFYDYGPWSPPMRFKLDSRRVGNPRLAETAAFMTPTFLWDRVEGAAGYTLQIDDDGNFSSPLVDQAIDGTSYTPTDVGSGAFRHGTGYYWRVAMRRSSKVIGHWTEPQTFVKTSPWPEPVAPAVGTEINRQPTFQWTAVLTPAGTPRLAAPLYRLQVDDDPSFSTPAINQTTQTTTFTPAKGQSLADGAWYWRVALVDANNREGPYSPPQHFVKEYPLPELQGPEQNATTTAIPTFSWTPVDGAAYYKVEYANNETFNRATSTVTDLTRYTPTNALAYSTYFWRVQMFDADKKPGPVIQGRFSLRSQIYLPAIQK